MFINEPRGIALCLALREAVKVTTGSSFRHSSPYTWNFQVVLIHFWKAESDSDDIKEK